MKKIIFNQLLKDIFKFFLLSSLSLSLIIWVIQAVNFLDYISEDGHGLLTYFYVTILNFPKIFSRILPFCVFVSIFYTLNRYEAKNELVIFWNIGINKLKFVNILVVFSLLFLFLQIFLNALIVPKTLDSAREYIRNSKVDFFPNLIKEKKFIGSGNYEREYSLGKELVSTEEFGKITGIGGKEYISLLLKRGTTPINSYETTSGGDGVHKPEGRRKKGLFFVDCLKKSQITYDRTINQFNTKVWVFKNINKDKIEKFKNYWKAKN